MGGRFGCIPGMLTCGFRHDAARYPPRRECRTGQPMISAAANLPASPPEGSVLQVWRLAVFRWRRRHPLTIWLGAGPSWAAIRGQRRSTLIGSIRLNTRDCSSTLSAVARNSKLRSAAGALAEPRVPQRRAAPRTDLQPSSFSESSDAAGGKIATSTSVSHSSDHPRPWRPVQLRTGRRTTPLLTRPPACMQEASRRRRRRGLDQRLAFPLLPGHPFAPSRSVSATRNPPRLPRD